MKCNRRSIYKGLLGYIPRSFPGGGHATNVNYEAPVVGAHVKAPRFGHPVCVVKAVNKPRGWRNGEWRYLITKCGEWLKHHPTRRNCVVEFPVNCLYCLAGEVKPSFSR